MHIRQLRVYLYVLLIIYLKNACKKEKGTIHNGFLGVYAKIFKGKKSISLGDLI